MPRMSTGIKNCKGKNSLTQSHWTCCCSESELLESDYFWGIIPALTVRERCLKRDGRRNWEAEKSGHMKEKSVVWPRGRKSPRCGVSRDISSEPGRGWRKSRGMGTQCCAWSRVAGAQLWAAGF